MLQSSLLKVLQKGAVSELTNYCFAATALPCPNIKKERIHADIERDTKEREIERERKRDKHSHRP